MVIPPKLISSIKSGSCVLFLGAGATKDAGGPVGRELAQFIASAAGRTDLPTDDLRVFADLLLQLPGVERTDIDALVAKSLADLVPSAGHLSIPLYCWQAIFSTNYDRLIEKAYDQFPASTSGKPSQSLRVVLDPTQHVSQVDRSIVALYKLHGCIANPFARARLVLSSADFEQTEKSRRKMLRTLKALAKDTVVLFAGYSFVDGVVPRLLDELDQESPYSSHRRMYLVVPAASTSQTEYFSSRNIELIPASFSEFFQGLGELVDSDAARACLMERIAPIRVPGGATVALPARLRHALHTQLEVLTPDEYPEPNATRFLSGLPPRVGDLTAKNDIEREQERDLVDLLCRSLESDDYVRPVVVVVGAGGTGKSTLAARAALEVVQQSRALAFRLKAPELWRRADIVHLATLAPLPSIFVVDGIELHSCGAAVRELYGDLTSSRCRSTLLLSCQQAVWNSLKASFPQGQTLPFRLHDQLSEDEARELVEKLAAHGLLETRKRVDLERQLSHVLHDCDGHLVVAMLSLVKSQKFRDILILEYENLSPRAKRAYSIVALLHQHGLSVPDYLLNALSVGNWEIFTNEVIRLESELVIVQDLDYGSRRLTFRTRHPLVARTIAAIAMPRHEDRVRTYRAAVKNLGGTAEDRHFLISLLTSHGLRADVREDRYVSEFFEIALDLFPNDRVLILHLGKFENQLGNLDRARTILEWGRSLDPSDSYIVHQLAINRQKCAAREPSTAIQAALFADAEALFRRKQLLDPISHYGFSGEALMQLERARLATQEEHQHEFLSAAGDAVDRGLQLVRENEREKLEQAGAEVRRMIGDPKVSIRALEAIEATTGLRYGASYHLLALCHRADADEAAALSAIRRGLDRFPGDSRLSNLALELLEPRLFEPAARAFCRELCGEGAEDRISSVRVRFVRAIVQYYESAFGPAHREFSRIREELHRRASTRIRQWRCDESGTPLVFTASVNREFGDRVNIVEPITGYRVPLDNVSAWLRLGRPTTARFRLGFSYAGERAAIESLA